MHKLTKACSEQNATCSALYAFIKTMKALPWGKNSDSSGNKAFV